MYAGRVACCPWWVTVSMPIGQTDGRTPGRYSTLSARRGQRKNWTGSWSAWPPAAADGGLQGDSLPSSMLQVRGGRTSRRCTSDFDILKATRSANDANNRVPNQPTTDAALTLRRNSVSYARTLSLFYRYFGTGVKYCDQRVCLFVCPLPYLKNRTSKFH